MNRLEKQLLKELQAKSPGARVLAFFVSGSHFFDLEGPNSDKDYRGVYLPTREQLNTQRMDVHPNGKKFWNEGNWKRQHNLGTNKTNTKNTKNDVDCIFYSLDEFLDLLTKGDFNMLEMLYATPGKQLVTSPEWEELRQRREVFTPVDLTAFLGFVKKEYDRFGLNQSSFWKYEKFVQFLSTLPPMDRLDKHWDALKTWNEQEKVGVLTTVLANRDSKSLPAFKVASRMQVGTNRVKTLIDGCQVKLNQFGHRQKSQASAGFEAKGLYHALRLLYEAQDLITYGALQLPFSEPRMATLKAVKFGTLAKEKVCELVDTHLAEVLFYDETQRDQMEVLTQKRDALIHRGKNHFYNIKMRMLLNPPPPRWKKLWQLWVKYLKG